MNEAAARAVALTRARTRLQERHFFWIGTSAVAVALAALLTWFLDSWPPHEDETLALFVGRGSLGDLLHTVILERGGAPLHFTFAWLVVHVGGGLGALRLVSVLFAVGSVPLIALLGARLAHRSVGVVATLLACGTWTFLFHGIYGRMYSLFLFTSLVSLLALLSALEAGGRRRFGLWGAALVLLLASHPYAVLVVAAEVLYLFLRREHLREACVTLAVVAVAGIPFWWADIVLRDRFDVGVGGGGEHLGSPGAVVHYLWWVSGDFGAGRHEAWALPVVLLAFAGAVLLGLRRRNSLLLIACVIGVPSIAFTLATLGSSTSPEARHLIFALPLFSVLLALPLVEFGRLRPPLTAGLALAALLALLVGEVRWAHDKTPALFDGDPASVLEARTAAAAWLASTARQDDVLLGYEPLYLRAWEQNRSFSSHAIPRADPALFATALHDVPEPLGRGVWVFDAHDTTNVWERQTISFALPQPQSMFEGRAFGPYLVIRSRRPLETRQRFLAVSETVMRLGKKLLIADADINLRTMLQAESRL